VPGCGGAGAAPTVAAVETDRGDETQATEISARNVGVGLRAGDESVLAPIALPPAPEDMGPLPDQRSTLEGFGAASGSTARGIDVSEFQGTIDWATVKSSGI